jgi:hypothetical protein
MYAKIKNGEIDIHPYSMENLYQELPNLVFDFQSSIFELFEKTSDFKNNVASLVSVTIGEFPLFNFVTKRCILSDSPEFVNGHWVRQYVILDKSQEEIENYDPTVIP